MMSARLWFAAIAALAGVLSTAPVGTGAEPASRIIDRTLLCKMTGVGYPDPVRILNVSSSTQAPDGAFPAQLYVSNGPAGGSGVSASVGTGYKNGPFKSSVTWTGPTCTVTKTVVPLNRKTLAGGPVEFSERYNCEVPARVLIRIRGIFERPAVVTRVGQLSGAKGALVYGYLSVATATGRKPIFFASMNGATQRAQVFVATSHCNED